MRLDPAGIQLPKTGRRAIRARVLLAAASGLAVLGAAGCAGSSNGGGDVGNTITIAAVPGVDNAPIYLAKKDGLFAAAGLKNVVIKSYSSQAAELAGPSGKVRYYEGTPIPSSLILVALLALCVFFDRTGNDLPLGVIDIAGAHWHPLSLIFFINGCTMISKTLHIPKL